MGPARLRICWALFLLLSLLPLAALLDPGWAAGGKGPGPRNSYLEKSDALLRTGSFPPPTEEDRAVLRGERPGLSDFRPPGYPIVLAALGATKEDWQAARRRLALLQWAAMLACIAVVHAEALRRLPPRWAPAASVLLGLQPWTSEFVLDRVPDTLTAVLAFAGLLLLSRAATIDPSRRRTALATAAAAALGAATLLRPEMLAFSPLLLAAGLLLAARRSGARAVLAPAAAVAAVLLLALGTHVAYRRAVFGEWAVVGAFQAKAPGMARWMKTWTSTERDQRRLWWRLANGRAVEAEEFPDRAFSSAAEREEVLGLAAAVAATGRCSPEQDAAFARLAGERSRGAGLLRVAGIRLWRTALLVASPGFGRSTDAGEILPRPLRRALEWCLYAMKFLVLCAAPLGLGRALRRLPGTGDDAWRVLLHLGALFVVARLAWFGLWMGILEARYALPLWPFLLLGALAAAAQSPRSLSEGTRERAVEGSA